MEDEALVEEKLLEELEAEEIPAAIREARLAALKAQAIQYSQLLEGKHGQYSELTEEKDFLELTTTANTCVIHFFHTDFRRCAIMDTHLTKLSAKYFETKFAKINVDKAKFFVEKLKIRILPAVIAFKNGVVCDRIIGFDDLGNTDSFPTVRLEKRLGLSGVIEAQDLDEDEEDETPRNKTSSIFGTGSKSREADSDDDNDW